MNKKKTKKQEKVGQLFLFEVKQESQQRPKGCKGDDKCFNKCFDCKPTFFNH